MHMVFYPLVAAAAFILGSAGMLTFIHTAVNTHHHNESRPR